MFEKMNGAIRRTGYLVTASDGTQDAAVSINQGVIPSARLAASVNPTAADIAVTVGGKQFKVVASLGAADTTVQVFREATAAATYSNLVDAINGKTSNAGVKWKEATTAFSAAVVADMATATQLRLRAATKRGGVAKAVVSSALALAAAVTGGASAWSVADLSVMGKSPADSLEACGQFAITAAMVTNTIVYIELPFVPSVVQFQATTTAGVVKTITSPVTVSGNALVITQAGATQLAATDIFSFWASI